jgi:LysM repeat protein
MNVQKRKLAMLALFVTASLLISCGSREPQTGSPAGVATATPLPHIIAPTASLPTAASTATIHTPPPALSPTGVATQEQATDPAAPATAAACVPQGEWVEYTVQVDDTLSLLAYTTNITVDELKQANCLSDDLIFAGQTLRLPFIPTSPPAATMAPALSPTVERPDAVTPVQPAPTATVEQPSAPSPTAAVEKPVAPGPGDPTLLIEPFSGPIGTRYTITLSNFAPKDTITIELFLSSNNALILTDSTSVDDQGNGIFEFVSRPEHPIDTYLVRATSNSHPEQQVFGSFEVGE